MAPLPFGPFTQLAELKLPEFVAQCLRRPRDVVFVVFDGIEWGRKWKIGEASVDAIHLIDGHLIFLEVESRGALRQEANEEIVGEPILTGKSGGRYRFKPREKFLIGSVAPSNGSQRALPQFVVVTAVTVSRCTLGKIAQVKLLLLFEDGVLCDEPALDLFKLLAKNAGSAPPTEKSRLT